MIRATRHLEGTCGRRRAAATAVREAGRSATGFAAEVSLAGAVARSAGLAALAGEQEVGWAMEREARAIRAVGSGAWEDRSEVHNRRSRCHSRRPHKTSQDRRRRNSPRLGTSSSLRRSLAHEAGTDSTEGSDATAGVAGGSELLCSFGRTVARAVALPKWAAVADEERSAKFL